MIISNTIMRKYVLLFILQMWYCIHSKLLIPDDYAATTITIYACNWVSHNCIKAAHDPIRFNVALCASRGGKI